VARDETVKSIALAPVRRRVVRGWYRLGCVCHTHPSPYHPRQWHVPAFTAGHAQTDA